MENKDWTGVIARFFQGAADLIDRAGEPIFSFLAVLVPFVAPVTIAQITASALVYGNILDQSQANQLAFVLEGIGIVGLSGLVIAIDKWIRSDNTKMDSMIYLLGFIDIIYLLFLVVVNVMLDKQNPNITPTQLVIKTLICLVPLMAGGIYGYYRILHKDKIAKVEADNLAEIIRQERRADKQQVRLAKVGVTPAMLTLQQTSPQVKEHATREAGDFRDYVMELLDQTNGQMPLTEITATVNKNKRVQFIHANVKGTWYKYQQAWLRNHQE
jgi:hypothetical protein